MSTINQIDLYDWQAWLDLAPDYDWGDMIPLTPEPEPDPEPDPEPEPAA